MTQTEVLTPSHPNLPQSIWTSAFLQLSAAPAVHGSSQLSLPRAASLILRLFLSNVCHSNLQMVEIMLKIAWVNSIPKLRFGPNISAEIDGSG